MQNNRVVYGYRDMPISNKSSAQVVNDKLAERIVSEFVIHATKADFSSDMDFKTKFQNIVKEIIPKHHISVNIEKKEFEVKGQRKLHAINIPKKEFQDVYFSLHPIVFQNSYGLFEFSVLIIGCPENIHPGTGKPK